MVDAGYDAPRLAHLLADPSRGPHALMVTAPRVDRVRGRASGERHGLGA